MKCGKTKPLTEFYRHDRMSDGRLNKCKSCCKIASKANRNRNVEYYAAYDQQRDKTEKRVETRKQYASSTAGKHAHAVAVGTYRERNPLKYKAHNAVNNAVRDGVLVKPKRCTVCRKVRTVQEHHEDYAQPLAVIWLCTKCHANEHH